jgi:hypothetical protein
MVEPVSRSAVSATGQKTRRSFNHTTAPHRHVLDSRLTLTVYDPCSPIGYTDSLRSAQSRELHSLVELRGVGDFELCLQLLAKANLLNISCAKADAQDQKAHANAGPSASDASRLPLERCTMNGLVQPRLNFASQEVYAFSEFFYSTYDIFGFTGRYNETRFREAATVSSLF